MSSKMNTSDTNIAGKDHIKVFCRLRPTENENEAICLKLLNDTTLLLTPTDKFLTSRIGTCNPIQFSFKQIFDETVSQDEVFEKVSFPLIKDLVFGSNGVLFTYGITSSGKTYTISGTPERCGLISRCLDTIFNTIDSCQAEKFIFKPNKSNSFDIQSQSEAMLDKQSELSLHTATPRPKKKEINVDWKKRVTCQRKIDLVDKGQKYAVFVSYVEIYNNYIYDLLQDPSVDPLKQYQTQSKLLREDASRNMYVSGATEVEVKNWEEAFDLFCNGQRRRRVSPMALHIESCRSHMVFTIRLAQASLDAMGEGLVSSKARVSVSQMSLVDLAGSERMMRTKTKGTTIQETCNINSSLMVFRSCIESLRESQHQGQPQIIPYRESKLTHLFKSFFEGEGKINILICVNPSVKYYEEMIYVMKFAESSQEVLIPRATPVPGAIGDITQMEMESHFGEYFLPENPSGLSTLIDFPSLRKNNKFDETSLKDLTEIIEHRIAKRMKMCRELKCLQEEFRKNLVASDKEILTLKQEKAFLTMDLEAREKQVKCFEKKQVVNEDTVRKQQKKVQSLERTARELEEKLKERDAALEKCEEYKDILNAKMQKKLTMDRKKITRTLEKDYKDKVAKALKVSGIAKEKVKLMKEILESNDAICSESDAQEPHENLYLSDQRSTGNTDSRSLVNEEPFKSNPQCDGGSKNTLRSFKTSFTNLRKDFNGCRSYVKSLKSNFSASTSNLRRTTTEPSTSWDDISASKRDNSAAISRTTGSKTSVSNNLGLKSLSSECILASTEVVQPKMFGKNIFKRIPVINPRHCRSRSSGKEFWVEHKPPGNLELGTVFQPRMQRKKSVSKLEVTDIVKNAQKYVLTHQEQDSEGEMETHLYKGDVFPSSCGGARVIFKDVERLKQVSPTLELGLRKKGTDHAELRDVQEKCAFSYECHGQRPETPKKH